MKNRLSIVLLVYTSEKFISNVIGCLLDQTDKDFELVIVNNASPDKSIEIALELLNKAKFNNYKIVNIDVNTGCGKGRTFGYKNATNEYVKFLDSDDILVENYVEEINKIISNDNPDLISYGHIVIDENGKEIRRLKAAKNPIVAKYSMTMFWRYAFKKDIAINNNINTSGMHYAEDRIFSLKLIPNIEKISILNKELYKYTKTSNSTTKRTDPDVFFESNCNVFSEYKKLYAMTKDKTEKKALFYQITKFYVTSLIIPAKCNNEISEKYYKIYKDIYFDTINEKRYTKLYIIPKGGFSKESFVIQMAYILLVLKQKWIYDMIFRRY